MLPFLLGAFDSLPIWEGPNSKPRYICCCASHLHSLCMPCAAGAHRVVVGCGIVAASVPHRRLYDPWNPLIGKLQAPEAASCTDVCALPHTFVNTMAVYYCPDQSASDRSLHQSNRMSFRTGSCAKGPACRACEPPAKVASCLPGGAASGAGGQVGLACRACFRMSAFFPYWARTGMKAVPVISVSSRCIAQSNG